MKKDLQNLARKNGLSAKVKAGRVAIMLKLYQDDPAQRRLIQSEHYAMLKALGRHDQESIANRKRCLR